MAQLLGSKISIQEGSPGARGVPSIPTNVVGAVGIAERGPIGVPTLCNSFDDYTRIFGGFTVDSDLALAALGFFENGGTQLWVVRTVHYTSNLNPATHTALTSSLTLSTAATSPSAGSVTGSVVAPFDLAHGDTLSIAVDGGAPVVATFNGTAPSRASANGPFALSNGQTLTLSINGGPTQTVTFLTASFVSIGAATAAEVAAVINASITGGLATVSGLTVVITTDQKGTGATVNITGGTANGVLAFTTGSLAGGGNVANIDAVALAEVKTIVEAAITGLTVSNDGGNRVKIDSNTTGVSSSIAVQAASTADDELGFDNAVHSGGTGAAVGTLQVQGKYPGIYADGIRVFVSAATSGDASEFNLSFEEDGFISEVFPNLTMDSTKARYAPTVINDPSTSDSRILKVTDLAAPGTATQRRPNVSSSAFGPLTGGDDGLTSLAAADFVGASSDNGKTGLRCLDTVQDLSLLFVPGQASAIVQQGMITYVEVTRSGQAFAILDPPAAQTATQMVTHVTTNLSELSEFAAIYWPRVKVGNPSKAVFGTNDLITVPPSGIIAGVYSRVDSQTVAGVYTPPAGIENGIMQGVVGFETDQVLEEAVRDLVYPKLINPLTTEPGLPRYIDGTRTLKSSGNFPTISERRGVIYIEQTIKKGIQFARHSNNTSALRKTVERTIQGFLTGETRKGAFRSTNPSEAFFVDFGDGMNPASVVFARQLRGRVGLATNKPIDWVIIEFAQDTRALDAELAAQ
jgi:phage tail sheath protein FI